MFGISEIKQHFIVYDSRVFVTPSSHNESTFFNQLLKTVTREHSYCE